MSDINLQQYIGSKIKHYREEQKLTQSDIAQALNTTRQTISRYESGERSANQDALFALASILNKKVDDFFPPRKLGGKLKEYRLKNKLTIDEFVKKYNEQFDASISKSMVSRWENDLAEPKIQVGKNIAIMYSIPFDELVGNIEPGQSVQDGQIIGTPTEKKSIPKKEDKNIKTIAAHLEGKDITDDKMKDVLNYIDFIFRDQFDK